jgi:hypothetical protein
LRGTLLPLPRSISFQEQLDIRQPESEKPPYPYSPQPTSLYRFIDSRELDTQNRRDFGWGEKRERSANHCSVRDIVAILGAVVRNYRLNGE